MRKTIKKFLQHASSLVLSLRTTLPYLLGSADRYREVTEEYPDRVSARMPEDLPARYRGFLHNDIERCSGCRYCEVACPVDCIKIETENGPDKNLSWVSVFNIDHGKCIFCGYCVEVCPTGSLQHTKEYQGSSFYKESLIKEFGKGRVSEEQKSAWSIERGQKEAKMAEAIQLEKNPVGAEVRRLSRGSREDE